MANAIGSQATLRVDNRDFTIFRLDTAAKMFPAVNRFPFAMKILLENLLRTENGGAARVEDIEAMAGGQRQAEPKREIAFTQSRVLLQDFTGVPAVVDFAAMRAAIQGLGGDPRRINPLQPA